MLSIQLPFTIFLQIYLTSPTKVIGTYADGPTFKPVLHIIAAIVTGLNDWLSFYMFTKLVILDARRLLGIPEKIEAAMNQQTK